MCLYPKLIENRKYKKNKKNGGIIPPLNDKRTLYVPVKCNKCMECMKAKSREWQVRLQEEIKDETLKKYFVTLTFRNDSIKELSKDINLEGYDRDNEIAKKGIRRFLERWRKKYKKSIRHWTTTELGHNGTENIHLHGILMTNEKKEDIEKIWQYGYVWIGEYVNAKTINYIIKYIHKIDHIHKEYIPKILTSPGIGNGYKGEINKYKENKTKEFYRLTNGQKISLPIYYRNKIYNEEEKEKLWLKKLDEEVRYINGKKIDISKGEEKYYKVLEYERKQNKTLGYADNTINWERRMYENQRRNLLHQERIRKKYEGDV